MSLSKIERRKRIKHRIRKVVYGSSRCPRLTVFRSNKRIYAQLIDDVAGKTLVSASSIGITGSKKDQAITVGKTIAEKAIAMSYYKVTFDRNGYLYHGRVKSLADAAREVGLKF